MSATTYGWLVLAVPAAAATLVHRRSATAR